MVLIDKGAVIYNIRAMTTNIPALSPAYPMVNYLKSKWAGSTHVEV